MNRTLTASMCLFGTLIGAHVTSAKAECDNGSLAGQYAFKAVGVNVGVLDSAGAVHPFASPLPVTGIGYFTFDGNGSLTKVDYNMGNGAPSISPAIPLTDNGFRTGQTGSYEVAADCTGTLAFDVPGGRHIVVAIQVEDYGAGLLGVVKSEHAPGLPAALVPSGTSCDGGCDLGDNILIEMKRNTSRRR